MTELKEETKHEVVAPDKPHKIRKWPKRLALILLALLIVGGAAAGGWFYQKKQTDKAEKKATEQEQKATNLQKQLDELKSASSTSTNTAVDETANWSVFSSASTKLSFKYKPGWSSKSCSDNNATAVFLAPPGTTQAICNSEKGSEVSVSSTPGDQRSIANSTYEGDLNVVKTDVTLNGVAGKKVSFTHSGNEFIEAGTKQVTYEFFTGGRTYLANYVQRPTDPDVLSDFELLVNKTLKFTG